MLAIRKYHSKILVVALLITIVLTSCQKDDPDSSYSYFVSKEESATYTKAYISSLLNAASGSIPEISNLKPSVKSDVVIYRIVYKTKVDGKEINASGLVCVPVTPGEYPVLSFQNGTNTVNAYSPSEFASNYSYQMIEIVASMGYIVVIADYPGFGESSDIPHPYLVKEPTVQSLIDMHFAVKEMITGEIDGVVLKDEYYLIGYSQGGWATLALHKAMELEYGNDFNLSGSACGAGPYNIYLLFESMSALNTYPMPVYLGYIVNAYTAYDQFTNPVTDIFNEPFASRVTSLYNGILSSDQINAQLTTSIPGLINSEFLTGFSSLPKYSSIREAMNNNSISAWHTYKPLLLVHGEKDSSVNPVTTERMYTAMLEEGTSSDICRKVIIPGADHGDGLAPFVIQSIQFLMSLGGSN
jgi:pimeloyl-ACP methyl ester carboxylesterase